MQTDESVEAYSGYRYGERPRAFIWHGRRYEVLAVERRWRTPQGPGFLVTAVQQSGEVGPVPGAGDYSVEHWELRYNEVLDAWHICRAQVEEDRCG